MTPEVSLAEEVSKLSTLVNELRPEIASIRSVVNGIRELQTQWNNDIVKELTEIKLQTQKTNGRVTNLEKKEVLNAVVRYCLAAVGLSIMGAVGVRYLELIGL